MSNRRALLTATLALPLLLHDPRTVRAGLPKGDRILVMKRQRRLLLMREEITLYEFKVALGRQPRGPKTREGDGRTPEGRYFIEAARPASAYYRALKISYPNDQDRQRARDLGVRPGGQIMIHGLDPAIARQWHNEHWRFNWTNGCIAVTNEEMDILWQSVAVGTPVEIRAE